MLGAELLERVLGVGLARGGDFAEVYLQDRTITSISLEDRKIERLQAGRERGAGVRVVVGAVTGFAYTDDLSEASLLRAARWLRAWRAAVPRGGRVAVDSGAGIVRWRGSSSRRSVGPSGSGPSWCGESIRRRGPAATQFAR